MVSFLSTLSLFILVLFNGCFTVPIFEQENLSSTLSTFIDNLTTESEFNIRSIPVDETSPLVDTENPHVSYEHMGYNMSTSVYNSTEEQQVQSLRSLEEFVNSSPMTFTSEESSTIPDQQKKRYQDEESSSTIESFTRGLRGLDIDVENDTDTEHGERDIPIELTTDSIFFSTSTPLVDIQQGSTSQPSTTTTTTQKYVGLLKDDDEQQHNHQSDQEHESKSKPEHHHQHQFDHIPGHDAETDVEHKPKPESDHEPHPQPHPHSKNEDEHVEEESTKSVPSKDELESTKKPKLSSYDEVQGDNSKESTAPTAVLDQEALKHVIYPSDNVLVLDENNSLIVTDIPQKFSTSTIKNLEEVTKLNQGKESLHVEEKESNH